MRIGTALPRDERGITLLEMMVVITILAIINSVVLPAVTGRTTQAREASRMTDEATVTRAVDTYSGTAPPDPEGRPKYPVWGGALPTQISYQAIVYDFVLPSGAKVTLYVKPIDFAASFTRIETGETLRFVPGHLQQTPKHARDLFDAAKFSDGRVSLLGGKDANGATAVNIGVWVLDQNAQAHALIDASYY